MYDITRRYSVEIQFLERGCCSGDAYVACGNYSQAKKFYTDAVLLNSELPQSAKAICYNTALEKVRYKMLGIPKHTVNKNSEKEVAEKVEHAIALQRLSMVSMVRDICDLQNNFKSLIGIYV